MKGLHEKVGSAVQHFWKTRKKQRTRQGRKTGKRDYGRRAAVTGGAQMDGFAVLVRELVQETGLPAESVFRKRDVALPGFFRPTKEWDLVIVANGHLLASVEFKSQIGSFGNNFNNRTEEAIGSALDIWTAYREGAFAPSHRPWLGYLMLLEEAPGSIKPVGVKEPHFKVFAEYRDSSYAKRYAILCRKLVRERLYNATCFLLTDEKQGPLGNFREPDPEVGFRSFAASLLGHLTGHAKIVG